MSDNICIHTHYNKTISKNVLLTNVISLFSFKFEQIFVNTVWATLKVKILQIHISGTNDSYTKVIRYPKTP